MALLVLGAFGTAGCEDEPADDGAVRLADAYTAIVEWQVGEQEPVLDEAGEPVLPLVFVVADNGATIDVGVQAEVAEATAEWATVRFADDVADTFDSDLDGEPVRNDGSLLVIGPMPDMARAIDVDVVRYLSVDDSESFVLEVTATPGPRDTTAVSPRAAVTAVSAVDQP